MTYHTRTSNYCELVYSEGDASQYVSINEDISNKKQRFSSLHLTKYFIYYGDKKSTKMEYFSIKKGLILFAIPILTIAATIPQVSVGDGQILQRDNTTTTPLGSVGDGQILQRDDTTTTPSEQDSSKIAQLQSEISQLKDLFSGLSNRTIGLEKIIVIFGK